MQAWAGFAGAGAVIWATYRGGDTFERWLKQSQTERKIAAGEKILTAVYKAKEAFPHIRSALHEAHELSAAEAKLKQNYAGYDTEGASKKQRLQTAQVVWNRLASYSEIWRELYECLPVARTYFGEEVEYAIRKIFKLRRRIEVKAEMYPDLTDTSDPFFNEAKCDLWEGWAKALKKKDEISTALRAVVERVEKVILPVLSDLGRKQNLNQEDGTQADSEQDE